MLNIFAIFLITQVSKVGVATSTFLSLNYDAVSASMGGAYVAVAASPMSGLTNPAGVANLKNKYTFATSNMNWVNIGYFPSLGAVVNMGNRGNIGVYLFGTYMGDMPETKVTEEGIVNTGNMLSYKSFVFDVTYAKYYTDKFSAGFSIKFFREDFGGYVAANNVALDIGSFYWTGFKSLRIGMVIQNLGPDTKPNGDYDFYHLGQGGKTVSDKVSFSGYPLPMTFRMGAAMEVLQKPSYQLTIAVEAIHPNDFYEGLSLGADLNMANMLDIRGGYLYNQGEQKFSTGFGVNVNGIGVAYSYIYMNTLPAKHLLQIFYKI